MARGHMAIREGDAPRVTANALSKSLHKATSQDALIWMSFDLGIQGDYEGLYAWLDRHGAKECGDSVAALRYPFKQDLIKELTADLKRNVKLEKRARVYVVYRKDGKVTGRFITGGRKNSPWAGYGVKDEDIEDS